jgi:omega-6 fatty acid desaturase (delta-12 desaturase)
MKNSLGWKVELSTMGCLTTVFALYKTLGWSSLYWYGGPYLVVNAWLVLYTWLHHTSTEMPHYGTDSFTFLKGALSTIDRPYPAFINHLHHDIGSTHVAHHVNYQIPHYRAREMTKELKEQLGDLYKYDPTPICTALLKVAKTCHYVDDIKGNQYYKSF